MFRQIKRLCLSVLCIAAAWIVYARGIQAGWWPPFNRPAGVPSGAIYVETPKRETWFECSVDLAKNVDNCRAWDRFGNLIAAGRYRLDGENRAATKDELRPSLVGGYWGSKQAWIYLFAPSGSGLMRWFRGPNIFGRVLVPVDQDGRALERFHAGSLTPTPRPGSHSN
jgi:hypothetical protein